MKKRLALEQDVITQHAKTYFEDPQPAKWLVDVMIVGEDRVTRKRETEIVKIRNRKKCALSDLVRVTTDVINDSASTFGYMNICYMQVYRL